MEQGTSEHEEVRFRRDEVAPLESFPSAGAPLHALCRARSFGVRWLLWPIVGLALAMLLLAGGISLFGVDAIGNERLRLQAERAMERLVGIDVDVSIGRLGLGLGVSSLFALEVHDARIVRADDGTSIATAGTLRFGLKALPLLTGRIELAQVAVAQAAFSPAGMPAGGLAWLASEPEGATPDAVRKAVFSSLHKAFDITHAAGLTRVSLEDVSLLGTPGPVIETLELSRKGREEIAFEGIALQRGRRISFQGRAARDVSADVIEAMSLEMSTPPLELAEERATSGLVRSLGSLDMSLWGQEEDGAGNGERLEFNATVRDALIGFGQDEALIDRAEVQVVLADEYDGFAIPQFHIAAGRSRIDLHGLVEPVNRSAEEPFYRINLLSRRSVLAPSDSPEPPLPFTMRMTGRLEVAHSRLTAEQIRIRTAQGGLTASASLTMPPGMSPGVTLGIYVADLPTAHVKQFWPWFAAAGARQWTLENVFGGHVSDGNLRFSVPPGRLGNGIPLSDNEVFGSFSLADTRFDIAGTIPPVRDATGSVAFRGTDVSVDLSAGTIYMPSGRQVDTSGGSFVIDDAHLKPRIGRLEIDVAGPAPAIIELASYEPIDASRFHHLVPEDLSGDMSGHIGADIPVQRDLPAVDLNWRVSLDYEDLSVAKPFDGQKVTDANGTMSIQPDRVEISAEAKLNGVPAELDVVQPLGGSDVENVRHVALKVDDASRERLFPGLGMLVSGPFTVLYEESGGERQKIKVLLDQSRLTVPWIGWSKGAGIPASASFHMKQDGNATELSDFQLSGDGFALSGDIRLDGGQLQHARFDHVNFNPADDYAALIERGGSGYAVTIDGNSIDARSIIKRALGGGEATSASQERDTTAVTVDASFARVGGFNGESLSQVELTYASDGGPASLSLSGATSRHGSARLTKTVDQTRHTVRATSSNAGAVLRFLDIYKHVENGQLNLVLDGHSEGDVLSGRLGIRDFEVVNEPRMRSLVAASERSANGQVDATRVYFERGAALLRMGNDTLSLEEGVLRGPLIGSTFQGVLYDANDNMDITGTFMPIYGFNRIFGEIPLIGQVLGNGRDRGLLGITYRLSGEFADPVLQVNPISALAPGFLRQLFEYR